MVSLRKLRHLSGKSSFPVEFPRSSENGNNVGSSNRNVKLLSVHPMPSIDLIPKKEVERRASEVCIGSSNASASSLSKEYLNQYFPGKQIKPRKRHRRKLHEDQEPCVMRGVYFKNMKWQAAIKVDKKQIHLGTVGSQEEAARLYDRAAYMCGREPNFDLEEDVRQELSQYKWEEFLAMTRNAISYKKTQRRIGGGGRRKKPDIQPQSSMDGSSMSDYGDFDTSVS